MSDYTHRLRHVQHVLSAEASRFCIQMPRRVDGRSAQERASLAAGSCRWRHLMVSVRSGAPPSLPRRSAGLGDRPPPPGWGTGPARLDRLQSPADSRASFEVRATPHSYRAPPPPPALGPDGRYASRARVYSERRRPVPHLATLKRDGVARAAAASRFRSHPAAPISAFALSTTWSVDLDERAMIAEPTDPRQIPHTTRIPGHELLVRDLEIDPVLVPPSRGDPQRSSHQPFCAPDVELGFHFSPPRQASPATRPALSRMVEVSKPSAASLDRRFRAAHARAHVARGEPSSRPSRSAPRRHDSTSTCHPVRAIGVRGLDRRCARDRCGVRRRHPCGCFLSQLCCRTHDAHAPSAAVAEPSSEPGSLTAPDSSASPEDCRAALDAFGLHYARREPRLYRNIERRLSSIAPET